MFTYLLVIKPTRCTNFSNLFLEKNSICFGQFLCPSSAVFHCTHSSGICHTGLLTVCERDQDRVPSWSCSLAVTATCMTYTTAVCTVKNSWWWTEELSKTYRVFSKNKFEELVHLLCFIIRIYHNTQSPECQICLRTVHLQPENLCCRASRWEKISKDIYIFFQFKSWLTNRTADWQVKW